MYQVLYRKYRPSNFNDVIGQKSIITTLINSISNNKISHAYLFSGSRGIGKTSVARIFANYINCESPKDGKICNECFTCRQFIENSSDIIEMDAASNNGVDEIRNLNNSVNLTPAIGKYKVYIIDEVHMLTNSAFNALLKTLEEPPKHVVFILATTEPDKIPETILSRVQKFDFKRVSLEDLVSHMSIICEKENIKYEREALLQIARTVNGGVRDSLSVLEKIYSFNGSIDMSSVELSNICVSQETNNKFLSIIENESISDFLVFSEHINQTSDYNKFIYNFIDYIGNRIKEYYMYETEDNIKLLLNLVIFLNNLEITLKTTDHTKIVFEVEIINFINLFNVSQETRKIKIEKKKEMNFENLSVEFEKTDDKQIDFKKFINIRINNVLINADKNELLKIKKNWKKLSFYIDNNLYKNDISLLIDVVPIVISDEYLLLECKNETIATIINYSVERLQKLLLDLLEIKIKIVAVSEKEWLVIKKQYIFDKNNNVLKDYEVEPVELEKKITQMYNLVNVFGENIKNILDYNE